MKYVIIILPSSNNIYQFLLVNKSPQKHYSYYMTIYENGAPTEEQMIDLFELYFWDYNILNAIILFWANHQLYVYTYFPFHKKLYNFAKNTSDPYQLYPNKALNLMGHQIKVALFNEPIRTYRPDEFILNEIVTHLNASILIVEPLSNETGFKGSNGLIKRQEVDIAMNLIYMRANYFMSKQAEYIALDRDDICILIPMSMCKKREIFFDIIVSIFMVCSVSFLIVVTGIYRLQSRCYQKIHQTQWFDMIQLYFNAGISRQPLIASQRILIYFWMTYCMIQTIVFSCAIVSSIVHQGVIKEINTIRQLGASNITIFTVDNLDYIVQHYFVGNDEQKLFLRQLVNLKHDDFPKLLNNQNPTTAIGTSQHAPFYEKLITMKNRNRIYYRMSETVVPFLAGYNVAYGSPYLQQFTSVVQHLTEGGFFYIWNRDLNFNKLVRNNDDVPLTIDHLWIFIVILIVGYGIGLMVFFIELLIRWFAKRSVGIY